MGNKRNLCCQLLFREVSWEELQDRDIVFYTVSPKLHADAHGPFTVFSAAEKKLTNGQGVTLKLTSAMVTLYVLEPILPTESRWPEPNVKA